MLQQIASKYLGLPDLFEDMEKKLGNTTCRLYGIWGLIGCITEKIFINNAAQLHLQSSQSIFGEVSIVYYSTTCVSTYPRYKCTY